MKKYTKIILSFVFVFAIAFSLVACGGKRENGEECKTAEKITLATVTLGEVEFENAETVKLEQDCDEVVVSGKIDAMSTSQKTAYGVDEITHVFAVKFEFDKERTLKTFEIKGNMTKVYSSDNTVTNYVGSLTDLLDSAEDEDAYAKLILSANTKEYRLTSTYTDGTVSEISIDVTATLAAAEAEE